jgi:hypothetical protein
MGFMKPKKSKPTSRKPARHTQLVPPIPAVWEELHRRIATRAYEIYEQRVRQSPVDDWLQAEQEIQKKTKVRKAKGVRTRLR